VLAPVILMILQLIRSGRMKDEADTQ
jgi:hypothetical protein